jgi:putative transposase
MRDISTLFLHAIVIVIRLGRPGGLRSVVAESVLMRHQVLILNRGRKRAPNLRALDRIIAGLCTLMMGQTRVLRSAIVLKPSTLLHFHKMLTKQKYRLLFSPERVRRPGPKGPTKELIDAVVEMKRRNRTWGCKRIAQQIALAFGVDIDKRRGPPNSRNPFPPGNGLRRSVMAVFHWSRERLAIVIGFVSM